MGFRQITEQRAVFGQRVEHLGFIEIFLVEKMAPVTGFYFFHKMLYARFVLQFAGGQPIVEYICGRQSGLFPFVFVEDPAGHLFGIFADMLRRKK